MRLLPRITAFGAGVLFALGLTFSGMTQPARIVRFLDFAGAWDPSLLLVMGAAIAVYLPLSRLITRRSAPLWEKEFSLPLSKAIDARLVIGAAIFGAGWGLGGFCPGPAITSLGAGSGTALVFFLAMIAGMKLFSLADTAQQTRGESEPETNEVCG